MVIYICEKCGKTFKQKGHYMKHLQRKTPCDNIKDKIENIVEKKVDKLVKEKLQDLVDKGEIEIKNTNLISNQFLKTCETSEVPPQAGYLFAARCSSSCPWPPCAGGSVRRPAQKKRPVPVKMMQRTSRSRSACRKSSVTRSSIAPEMVFCTASRLMVMVAMCSLTS